MTDTEALLTTDRKQLLHPLHHPSEYETALVFTKSQGIWLTDTDGRTYIDGLSGLWNVFIGHGNHALGEVDNAARQGARLAHQLGALKENPLVGDVRGIGLMWGLELVVDRETREPFPDGEAVRRACQSNGLFTRMKGNILILAPPLIITDDEVDEMVAIMAEVLDALTADRA